MEFLPYVAGVVALACCATLSHVTVEQSFTALWIWTREYDKLQKWTSMIIITKILVNEIVSDIEKSGYLEKHSP